MGKVSMKGVIEMHVHSNPDIRRRAYDDFEMLEAGIRVGARAIVLKTHQGTTMDRAYLCNRHNKIVHGDSNNFTMIGSVTLNNVVGGINPAAVESGLKLGAKVIWLPTQSARNHFVKNKKDPSNCAEVVKDGKVVSAMGEIFKMINDFGAVLATGHISPVEVFVVVEAARNAGVKNIVVTHPEWWLVDMSFEDQVKIVKDYDVILERCYAQNLGDNTYKSNLQSNLEIIKTVGYKNVSVSTDGGQTENPPWEVCYEEYMQFLSDNGIPDDQLKYMTSTVQSKLLGLND